MWSLMLWGLYNIKCILNLPWENLPGTGEELRASWPSSPVSAPAPSLSTPKARLSFLQVWLLTFYPRGLTTYSSCSFSLLIMKCKCASFLSCTNENLRKGVTRYRKVWTAMDVYKHFVLILRIWWPRQRIFGHLKWLWNKHGVWPACHATQHSSWWDGMEASVKSVLLCKFWCNIKKWGSTR